MPRPSTTSSTASSTATTTKKSAAAAVEYMTGFQGSRLFALLRSPPTRSLCRSVVELINDGEDPSRRGDFGESYLHLLPSCAVLDEDGKSSTASTVDHVLPVVYQLAAAGADVDAVDDDGNTPLHICVVTGAGHRMARALLRVGVDPSAANCRGETAASLVADLPTPSGAADAAVRRAVLVDVLSEAGSGLWAAVVTDADAARARRLVDCRYAVDLVRKGRTMMSAARQSSSSIDADTLRYIDDRAPTVRLAHAALAGDASAVRELLVVDARRPEIPAPEPNARDAGYRLDDGRLAATVTSGPLGWPLLAEVIRLRLFSVAVVLVKTGNADVNATLRVDATASRRPVPLFQWAVTGPMLEFDEFEWNGESSTLLQLFAARADLSLIDDAAEFVHDLFRLHCRLYSRQRRRQRSQAAAAGRVTTTTTTTDGGSVDEVIGAFVRRDVSMLSRRDADGNTARDLIMLDSVTTGGGARAEHALQSRTGNAVAGGTPQQSTWKSVVRFVDVFVVDAVRRQQIDRLEALAFDGYDYINVDERNGDKVDAGGARSVRQMAIDENLTASAQFLERLPDFQKRARLLHRSIARGNLADMRRNIDSRVVRVRDRAGHRALHVAVLFERRFIIRELIEKFPDTVNLTDFKNRTPLHYAHCLEYGAEIVRSLLAAGADAKIIDQGGRKPADYSTDPVLQQSALADERSSCRSCLQVGGAFVVERYLAASDAIRSGRRQRVRELVDTLTGDELNRMSPSGCRLLAELVGGGRGRQAAFDYRPLLFQCVDAGLEDVAVHLVVDLGADYGVTDFGSPDRKTGDKKITLLEAANGRFMYKLVECIRTAMVRDKRKNQQPEVWQPGEDGDDNGHDDVTSAGDVISEHSENDVVMIDMPPTPGNEEFVTSSPTFSFTDDDGDETPLPAPAAAESEPMKRGSSPVCLIL